MSFSSNVIIEYKPLFTKEELEQQKLDVTLIKKTSNCNKNCLSGYGPSLVPTIDNNNKCIYCN